MPRITTPVDWLPAVAIGGNVSSPLRRDPPGFPLYRSLKTPQLYRSPRTWRMHFQRRRPCAVNRKLPQDWIAKKERRRYSLNVSWASSLIGKAAVLQTATCRFKSDLGPPMCREAECSRLQSSKLAIWVGFPAGTPIFGPASVRAKVASDQPQRCRPGRNWKLETRKFKAPADWAESLRAA